LSWKPAVLRGRDEALVRKVLSEVLRDHINSQPTFGCYRKGTKCSENTSGVKSIL
jgi:hypothetical protein